MTAAAAYTPGPPTPEFTKAAVEPLPCRYTDPDVFFEEIGDPNAAAKRKTAKLICAGCPFKAACLEYALEHPSIDGVWGGTTLRDRNKIRREQSELARVAKGTAA